MISHGNFSRDNAPVSFSVRGLFSRSRVSSARRSRALEGFGFPVVAENQFVLGVASVAPPVKHFLT